MSVVNSACITTSSTRSSIYSRVIDTQEKLRKKKSYKVQVVIDFDCSYETVTCPSLHLNLALATIGSFNGECRARSDCTYVQSDLVLHSPLLNQYFSINETKPHPVS